MADHRHRQLEGLGGPLDRLEGAVVGGRRTGGADGVQGGGSPGDELPDPRLHVLRANPIEGEVETELQQGIRRLVGHLLSMGKGWKIQRVASVRIETQRTL